MSDLAGRLTLPIAAILGALPKSMVHSFWSRGATRLRRSLPFEPGRADLSELTRLAEIIECDVRELGKY
jgi:hypothetical protein